MDEEEIISYVPPPYKFYVSFDDDGNIVAVGTEIKENYNSIETTFDLIEDFFNGKKSFNNFKITLTNDKTRLVENKKPDYLRDFFIIDELNLKADLVIKVRNNEIEFKLKDSIVGLDDNFTKNFYIVNKSNYNFLYKTISLTTDQMKKGKKIDYDFNVDTSALVTLKIFNTYGIVYDKKN